MTSKNKQCYLCSGILEPGYVTAENWWGEELALIENVPALICQNCGEPVFDAATCKKLDELRKDPAPKTREVPVYSFVAEATAE